MSESPIQLVIIIGSTREGRFGPTVAHWFINEARERHDVAVDVIDLVDIRFPAHHPQKRTPEIEAFAARIDAGDGFVIVTPEYNHGYPASLKFAIDSANREWRAKPVGFVSYGGLAGGLRSVEQLRQVFAELHAVTIRDTVSFHLARGQFDEDGQPKDPTGPSAAAKTMLDQLVWWASALRDARAKRPYGS